MYGSKPTCCVCGGEALIARGHSYYCGITHSRQAEDLEHRGLDHDSYFAGYDDGISAGRTTLYQQIDEMLAAHLQSLGSHDMRSRNAMHEFVKKLKTLEACDALL